MGAPNQLPQGQSTHSGTVLTRMGNLLREIRGVGTVDFIVEHRAGKILGIYVGTHDALGHFAYYPAALSLHDLPSLGC